MPNDTLKNLIIFTTVRYGNDETSKVRSELCLKMLRNADELGLKVVVKNNGVSEEFLKELNKFQNVTVIQNQPEDEVKSIGEGRREALRGAIEIAETEKIDSPCFFWTEPEKNNLITEEKLSAMVSEIKNGSNIVVPDRGEKAWQQLPKFQHFFEQRANKRVKHILEKKSGDKCDGCLDLWFGPKMFDKAGSDYFLNYNQNKDRVDLWDATIVPVMDAVRERKITVTSVPVDFLYDESQIEDEIKETRRDIKTKRLEQYAQILKEAGDDKWIEFFNETKVELAKIKELKSKGDVTPENQELLNAEKRKFLKKFFK